MKKLNSLSRTQVISKTIEELEHLTMMNFHLSNRAIYPTVMAENGTGIISSLKAGSPNAEKEVIRFAKEVKDLLNLIK